MYVFFSKERINTFFSKLHHFLESPQFIFLLFFGPIPKHIQHLEVSQISGILVDFLFFDKIDGCDVFLLKTGFQEVLLVKSISLDVCFEI